MNEVIELILNNSNPIVDTNFISEDQVKEIQGLGIEYVDNLDGKLIPVCIRCPKYNVRMQVGGLIEKLGKLSKSGVSNKIYKFIGVVESPQHEDDVYITSISIIEEKFSKFSEEELREIIHNEDEEYKIE